jgi:hypothetical protein
MSNSVQRVPRATGDPDKTDQVFFDAGSMHALKGASAGHAPSHSPDSNQATHIDAEPNNTRNGCRQSGEWDGQPSHKRRIGVTILKSVDIPAIQEPTGGSKINFIPFAVMLQEKRHGMKK